MTLTKVSRSIIIFLIGDTSDEESELARDRVIMKYKSAKITTIESMVEKVSIDPQVKYAQDFSAWKNDYYCQKLGFRTMEERDKMVFHYIEGTCVHQSSDIRVAMGAFVLL